MCEGSRGGGERIGVWGRYTTESMNLGENFGICVIRDAEAHA